MSSTQWKPWAGCEDLLESQQQQYHHHHESKENINTSSSKQVYSAVKTLSTSPSFRLAPTPPHVLASINQLKLDLEHQHSTISLGSLSALSEEQKLKRQELLSKFESFLFDCDGVLWLHHTIIEGARETIMGLRKLGKKIFFVTNNSTQSRQQYVEKLAKFGIVSSKSEILSSSFAAAAYFASLSPSQFDRTKQKVFYIGGEGIAKELQELDIPYIHANDIAGNDHWDAQKLSEWVPPSDIGAVLVGSDQRFTYTKCALAINCLSDEKKLFVCTNTDSTFPSTGATLPGAGSVVAMVSTASMRTPVDVGKPSNFLFELAHQWYGVDISRAIVVGDRLDTDIMWGNRSGASTLLVLTGITSANDLNELNDKELIPTYAAPSVAHILVTRSN